jgi:ribosomal protein S18 acetylase RimI-like enzyme
MIRNATPADIPKLVEMGQRLHDESNYSHVTYSPERVKATCLLMMNQGFLVVSEKNGVVVGVMMGDVQTAWYTNERMGFDLTLYIEPEHRSGLMAARMIRQFEQWCKAMGATQIRPGVSTGSESASKLYKALGYVVTGEQFLKDI